MNKDFPSKVREIGGPSCRVGEPPEEPRWLPLHILEERWYAARSVDRVVARAALCPECGCSPMEYRGYYSRLEKVVGYKSSVPQMGFAGYVYRGFLVCPHCWAWEERVTVR
jgi:hypothetical protein